jgi:cytochrome c oxidase subunit 4
MSTVTEHEAQATGADAATETEHLEHEHPRDLLYVQVALVLAVLTAAEVATYNQDFSDALGDFQVPMLLLLMTIKFSLVIMFFMHLRFDHRLFSWVFIGGLVLASVVYIATLLTFQYWS